MSLFASTDFKLKDFPTIFSDQKIGKIRQSGKIDFFFCYYRTSFRIFMDKSRISSPIQNQHLYRVVEAFSYPKLKPEMVLWIPNGNAQCLKVQVKVEAKVVEDPECSTILSTEIGSAVLMKRILMRMLLSMMDRFCLQLHFHQ